MTLPKEFAPRLFWKPSRGRLGARRGRKVLDDHKAVDFSLQVGVSRATARGVRSGLNGAAIHKTVLVVS
jgi:hypothetical protein